MLTGREAFLALLADEGVTHLFGNPGTTELPIMEALGAQSRIAYVLGLQESVVVGMADGYARASGRIGACNVHVAPGLGNAIGALYNAKGYGSPLIVTAGQQEQGHGLTEPLLYDPLVPIAQPVVKWAVEVTRYADLPRILRRAAKVATTPPTGPVFISLPGDILDDAGDLDLGRRTRVETATRPDDATLERLAGRLLAARQPLLVAGHELQTRDAWTEAAALAELLGAPVYQQTCPSSAHFPSEHRCYMGGLSRNQPQVRQLLEDHDLLVCLGSDVLRMSVQSPVDPLPPGMAVVQISERSWELGKNYPAEIAVGADVRETLRALLPVLRRLCPFDRAALARERLEALGARNWSAQRERLAREAEASVHARPLDPLLLMKRLAETLPDGAIVVDEGLTSTMALPGLLPFRDRLSYFGLATGGIGFGMAGAVGMSLAAPERRVVAAIGDGSAMYSVQALWTAAHLRTPVTFVICNNGSYRILKERLVAYRRTERFVGMDLDDPPIDFAGMARSLGVPARRVEAPDDIVPALREAHAASGPWLLDVAVAKGFGG